jgi:hypothetical protein
MVKVRRFREDTIQESASLACKFCGMHFKHINRIASETIHHQSPDELSEEEEMAKK